MEATKDQNEELGLVPFSPRFPQYASEQSRLTTFKTWPACNTIQPESLAASGLVYTGTGDSVRCFWCNGGLRNWEVGENADIEHARWYSKCGYIRLKMGDEFVERVKNGSIKKTDMERENVNQQDLKSCAVETLLYWDYDISQIKKSIAIFRKDFNQCTFCATDLLEIIDKHDIKVEEARSETTIDNECQVCFDGPKTIMFSPCHHIVACLRCVVQLKACCICRSNIRHLVRIEKA